MTKYLMDSFAIVECFIGTEKGEKVRAIMASKENTCYLASESIAEVVSSVIRNGYDPSGAIDVMRNIRLLQLDADTAEDAGRLHVNMRQKVKDFGLIDAVLLAIARKNGLKLLTGDPHFKGVPEAVLI